MTDDTLFTMPAPRIDGRHQRCHGCEVTKPTRYFPSYSFSPNYARPLCTLCQRRHNRIVRRQNYALLVKHQGGERCRICAEPPPAGRRLAIDVCHRTWKVRGLLCTSCNVGLGMFQDDLELLVNAVHHVSQFK